MWPSLNAAATTLSLDGSAGTLSAPEFKILPTVADSITHNFENIVPGTGERSATGSIFVQGGVVRLTADTSAIMGSPSLGNIQTVLSGTWEDTLTFNAPGDLPGFPGIEIIEGITDGVANLNILLTGSIAAEGPSEFFSSYKARLSYGPGGSANRVELFGEIDSGFVSGSILPGLLSLEVFFTYGVAFDIKFTLDGRARLGWEGNAPEDMFASVLLGESATWDGVGNVRAMVPDGEGGLMTIDLPESTWSATSSTIDYTMPIPEPGTLTLLLSGLVLLTTLRRRR